MTVVVFKKISFEDKGHWEQTVDDFGNIVYEATTDRARVTVTPTDGKDDITKDYNKGTKVIVVGDVVHLPD